MFLKLSKLFQPAPTILFLSSIFLLFFCSSSRHTLNPFKSDGCSMFPDRSIIDEKDWSACCLEHDILYWHGGTKQERLRADSLFKECVLEKTGDKKLAELMYRGVRFGGSPNFPTWYRWGYGWNYMRDYKPLTEEEIKIVQQRLTEYYLNVNSK